MISDSLPTRAPVHWSFDNRGLVTIKHEKSMGAFERFISKFFNAPKTISRPLDEMNTHLWLLMDGTHTLSQIIIEMDNKFAEQVAPVSERISMSISGFINLGLAVLIRSSEELTWDVGRSD